MQENSNSKSVRSPFLTRTLTGILFVAVMVGGILYSPFTCALLFLLITVLSVWEFTGLVNTSDDVQVNRLITTLAAVCLYLGIWGYEARINSAVPLFAPWLLSMIYLMIAELYLQRERPLNNWAYAMWAQIYVALPFSLTALLATSADRLIIVLCIFVFLWCSDTGAYCCGSLFGRHKLFLRVSPGKTWEGSIGGGVLTLAASQLVAVFVSALTSLQWAGFALVVVIFGTWGDLVESLFKRQLGVKDSGHILPGHGGMLDRFDSSLLAIPACIVYLYALSVL